MLKKNSYRKCQIALTSRDLLIASALAKTINVIAPRDFQDDLKDQLLDALAEKQEEYSDDDHTEGKIAQDVEMNLAQFINPADALIPLAESSSGSSSS